MINKKALHVIQVLLLLFIFSHRDGFSQPYTAGNTYFGSKGYIEYGVGSLPIIISAPHGGDLKPNDIPDRSCPSCIYGKDGSTQEIVRDIREALFNMTGSYPNTIINLLSRSKLDANRDKGEAACGNVDAEKAWYDYHTFIDSAKKSITGKWGKGFYIDIHAHGHSNQRLELGYLLTTSNLTLADLALNTSQYIDLSSIRNLAKTNINSFTHSELLRGDYSLGTLLDTKGYRSVPSAADPFPLSTELYFTGGYNTQRHGSRSGGYIDGVQIETNSGVRSSTSIRQEFAYNLAIVILEYLNKNYFADFSQSLLSYYPDSAINLKAIDVAYTQIFDEVLGAKDTTFYNNDSKFPGLYTYRTLSNGTPQLFTKYLTTSVIGKHYNFGNSATPNDRAIGVIYSSTTGPISFGMRFRNNTGVEISSLVISYTGEEWRSGSGGQGIALNELVFDYRQAATVTDLKTGTYTSVDELKFTAPFVSAVGSTAITLDGNNPSYRKLKTATINVKIPVGEEIMLRWSDITDDPSYDCALGIDDLSVTPKSIYTWSENRASENEGVLIYPNPVVDVLHVNFRNVNSSNFEIYNITGNCIMSGIISTDVSTVNISKLSKGFYLFRIRSSHKTITSKFVKN